MYNENFVENSIITFCNDDYVVLENLGEIGRVQQNRKNGAIIRLSWEYRDEICVLKENGIDKR